MKSSPFDCYLLNGTITVFCGTHTDAFKQDILNSNLYAALVASQSSVTAEANWEKYRDTISKLSWTINSQESKHVNFEKSSLINLIAISVENALPSGERQIVANAFSHIKNIDCNAPALEKLLETLNANVSAATGGTYTTITIVRANKSVITVQMSFEVTHLDLDILDLPVLTSTKDDKTNIRVMRSALDERQYAKLRDTIIKKLGSKIETDLFHIPMDSLS